MIEYHPILYYYRTSHVLYMFTARILTMYFVRIVHIS